MNVATYGERSPTELESHPFSFDAQPNFAAPLSLIALHDSRLNHVKLDSISDKLRVIREENCCCFFFGRFFITMKSGLAKKGRAFIFLLGKKPKSQFTRLLPAIKQCFHWSDATERRAVSWLVFAAIDDGP